MAIVKKRLFDGSIQIELPDRYIDVSDLRQVPDNQEAFVDCGEACLCRQHIDANDGKAANTSCPCCSLIIEVVEPIGDPSLDSVEHTAVSQYLWDLLSDESANITIPSDASVYTGPIAGKKRLAVVGYHCANRPEDNPTDIHHSNSPSLYMAAIRISEAESDILITLNAPNVQHEFAINELSAITRSLSLDNLSLFGI